jgi:hypothetical protein
MMVVRERDEEAPHPFTCLNHARCLHAVAPSFWLRVTLLGKVFSHPLNVARIRDRIIMFMFIYILNIRFRRFCRYLDQRRAHYLCRSTDGLPRTVETDQSSKVAASNALRF